MAPVPKTHSSLVAGSPALHTKRSVITSSSVIQSCGSTVTPSDSSEPVPAESPPPLLLRTGDNLSIFTKMSIKGIWVIHTVWRRLPHRKKTGRSLQRSFPLALKNAERNRLTATCITARQRPLIPKKKEKSLTAWPGTHARHALNVSQSCHFLAASPHTLRSGVCGEWPVAGL